MTLFHGNFMGKHLKVVTLYRQSLSRPNLIGSIEAVSFGFPDSFRLADFLPTAVLPDSLSLLSPTCLFNCR